MKRCLAINRVLVVLAILGLNAGDNRAQHPELVVQSGHVWGSAKVTFSPDGRILASGSSDNTIKFWDVVTSTQLRSLAGHLGWVNSIAFNFDGTTLASA